MAIVAVNMTSDSIMFMENLLKYGAVSGTPPNLTINQSIRPLVDALYEVLAGGRVTEGKDAQGHTVLTIDLPGTASTRQALHDMESNCTKAINNTNNAAGFNLVIEF